MRFSGANLLEIFQGGDFSNLPDFCNHLPLIFVANRLNRLVFDQQISQRFVIRRFPAHAGDG